LQQQTAESDLAGFRLLQNSINAGENLFEGFSIYRSMYEDYALQLRQLTDSYETALDDYNFYTALFASGAASATELQNATTMRDSAAARLTEFETNYAINLESEIFVLNNTITRLENQQQTLRTSTLANIGSQILAAENIIAETTAALARAGLQQDALFFVGDEVGDAALLRLGEINLTLGQISQTEQDINRLELNIANVDAQINDSTVRAPMDGEITVHIEPIVGSFLPGGVQVLSVLPMRDDTLNANIFVSNNDIGRLTQGMTVRYDIAAMPRRDFGDITGEITRIATDISAQEGMFGYFLVESELADKVYTDIRGNEASLRVGMAFEARIIVERQRILFYLLDRLNLRIG